MENMLRLFTATGSNLSKLDEKPLLNNMHGLDMSLPLPSLRGEGVPAEHPGCG